MCKYVYSHNEVTETAQHYIKRIKVAHEITQQAFIKSVGKGAYNELVNSVGRKAIAFYKGVDCVFIDIQNIHFIFTLLQED
jgi:hypothetical protein|tara:strand:- start:5136 stop:5378 length:243 start_codon:yes stop_codon:yes gene_type:complete